MMFSIPAACIAVLAVAEYLSNSIGRPGAVATAARVCGVVRVQARAGKAPVVVGLSWTVVDTRTVRGVERCGAFPSWNDDRADPGEVAVLVHLGLARGVRHISYDHGGRSEQGDDGDLHDCDSMVRACVRAAARVGRGR